MVETELDIGAFKVPIFFRNKNSLYSRETGVYYLWR